MILENTTANVQTVADDSNGKKMNISTDAKVQAHMINILTDYSYKRKIESTIRETVSNSIDSHIMAKKPDEPVLVSLKKNTTTGQWYFRSEDKGLGLDDNEFYRYIMGIGESTKSELADVLGMFGAGAKAPLSKVNSYDWICRKDGIERRFSIFKTSTVPDSTMHYERETDKPNGVIVHIDVPRMESISLWKQAMREQLSYFPNIIYDVDDDYDANWNNYKIFRSEDFEWSEMSISREMHISLGGVYYPIDWKSIGMNDYDKINVPIALKFGLNDGIRPTFSREELQYNEKTKQIIRDKMLLVSLWFVDKYNAKVKDFDTLLEAINHIGTKTYYVTVENNTLNVTSLFAHTDVKPNKPKIKGIELNKQELYKNNFEKLFHEFIPIANLQGDSWAKKNFLTVGTQVRENNEVVVLSETPVGRFKTFLRHRYEMDTLFVVKERKLRLFNHAYNGVSYKSILELKQYERVLWRSKIQEWQAIAKTMIDTFTDGTGLQNSEAFKEWLEEEKQLQKERRNNGTSSGNYNYKRLNKEKGDITLMIGRKHKYESSVVFDKETAKIEELHRRPFITVYYKKNDDINHSKLVDFIEAFQQYKFVKIGEREIKHVTDKHNFLTMEQFMVSKPLSRFATAMKINEILELVPENEDMMYASFPNIKTTHDKLETYARENYTTCSQALKIEILKHVEDNNLWDMEIYGEVMTFRKDVLEFGFLNFVEPKTNWRKTQDQINVAKNICYVLLLHKRRSGKMIEEFELVAKPIPQPVEPEEVDEDDLLAEQDGKREEEVLVDEVEPETGDPVEDDTDWDSIPDEEPNLVDAQDYI